MEDIVFRSLSELYERVLPALRTKRRDLLSKGNDKITEEDIWNYFKNNVWVTAKSLTLSDMVDDILNTDNLLINNYFYKNLNLITEITQNINIQELERRGLTREEDI